jgi:polysaccharide pyruvyl transferase WcaK-like protein
VRDRQSQHLLEEIGVHRGITVTADPAVLLQPEPLTMDEILRAEAIEPRGRLIGMSVREPGPAAPDLDVDHYHRLLANAADFMVARLDAEVVFLPLERRAHDVQHSHGVVAHMRHAQCATVLKGDYRPGQLVSLLRHFQFSVGMRIHFLIFSALADVPFVALPYATKVTGFLDGLDVDCPALEHVSAGQLIATIDRAWDLRERLRARIRDGLGRLKTLARRNNELALHLITEGGMAPQPSPGADGGP